MPEQSSAHAYLNWTKQRIDEMDATLTSLESTANQFQADSKATAQQLIADMKKRRDAFQAKAKSQAQVGEAALQAGKAQLEAQWGDFETQVEAYFDTVGKQIEQKQSVLQGVAAAHAKAWREAVDAFHGEAAKAATAGRADLDFAVKQMKTDAVEAEARLKQLMQAGSQSWSALSAALSESRQAFDRANQKAADAFKGAGADKKKTISRS